jgi:hypothetical protein
MDLRRVVWQETHVWQEMRVGTSRRAMCTSMAARTSTIKTPRARTSAAGVQVCAGRAIYFERGCAKSRTDKSPWTALEYCDEDGIDNTWVCHSPESCGCDWKPTWDLLVLPLRGCSAMGKDARVALYAPDALAPWALLPNGTVTTTAYFKTYTTDGTVTWTSTAIKGCKPSRYQSDIRLS